MEKNKEERPKLVLIQEREYNDLFTKNILSLDNKRLDV
tara:strand:- start:340 stop:453 length:114 start_codon:yes stop_codon:yes gene_type:complete